VTAAATGLVNPGHLGLSGAIVLMLLPGEQVPGHAACQLDQQQARPSLLPNCDSQVPCLRRRLEVK
jgi:hypothetical protein